MSGELWQTKWQIGKETAYGTPVAATRIMYFQADSKLTREREAHVLRALSATREAVREVTLGPEQAGGQVSLPVSAEILELLLMGIKGNVTGSGVGLAKTWTFKPDVALDSATIEWHDGARGWQAAGCYASRLNFKGSVSGENVLTADIVAKTIVQQNLTAALASRVPAVFEGWESKLYIDNFGSAPGTTAIADFLIDWDVTIDNAILRKYTANNTQTLSAAVLGELSVEATLRVEASTAQALTEFNNMNTPQKRVVRLEFGNNKVIEGADKEKVTIDIPGAWTAIDLGGEDEGTRVYELRMTGIYEPTNLAASLQIVVVTARATAW